MNRGQLIRFFLAGLLLVYLIFWLPLPYVVVQPGSAEEITDMVHMDAETPEAEGHFMLTTIRMTYPHTNVANYLLSYVRKYAHVSPREDILGGRTQQEYSQRQSYVMLSSQSNAMQAAYSHAGVPYEIKATGVMILQTDSGRPAAEKLQAGDQILKLDDQAVEGLEELLQHISGKQVGDTVQVTFEREQEEKTETIQLVNLAGEEEDPRPGLGIYLAELQKVTAQEAGKQVEVSAGNIGGPSAGLMFSLEIYNRLVEEDITKGYEIAGTGEISPKGKVGIIGGVDYKVVAADRVDADIFFTPIGNAPLAQETAEEIGTDMKVVPVDTLQEALDYLASLPDREA